MIFSNKSELEDAHSRIGSGLPLGIYYLGEYAQEQNGDGIRRFTFRVSAHKSNLTSTEKEVERVTFVLSPEDTVEIFVSSVRVEVVQVDDVDDFIQFVIDLTHHIYVEPADDDLFDHFHLHDLEVDQ